jgi:hypothetical protein
MACPRLMNIPRLVCLLVVAALSGARAAAELKWEPDANMERQLFPSLLIATATQRPEDDGEEPDPELLGDRYGSVGIAITAPKAGAKVRVTVLENAVMSRSSWSGVLEKAGTEYYVAPAVNYKYDALRQTRQQVPLNVTFNVEVDGKSIGEKTETLTLRSINECPFAVSDAEDTIDEQKSAKAKKEPDKRTEQTDSPKRKSDKPKKNSGGIGGSVGETAEEAESSSDEEKPASDDEQTSSAQSDQGYTDMGWMFAAYVNENSPIVETILKEALATKIVDSFAGYQKEPAGVVKELFAIWSALQKRGIHYSNITTTAAASQVVYSQHVRFVEQSVANEQANCVDGSVVFTSILRKLGLRTFLVTVPGHMFMGIYLTPDGDERIALETTMIGSREDQEEKALEVMDGLREIRGTLDKKVAQSVAWKTFATALAVGTSNLVKNEAKFEGEDEPQYQITDINDARADGIMPIGYVKE